MKPPVLPAEEHEEPTGKAWLPSTAGAITGLGVSVLSALFPQLMLGLGYGLFCAAPLLAGMMAGVIIGADGKGRLVSLGTATLVFGLVVTGFLLATMSEGLVCLAMAAPIVLPCYWLGGYLGFVLSRGDRNNRQVMAVFLLPVLCGFDYVLAEWHREETVTTTTFVMEASPEEIWGEVTDVGRLPESDYFLFRAGVAHPVEVTIYGEGAGAVRVCELSTGPMPERVTVWEPGRVLEFQVLHTPAAMKETNPLHPDTAPAHLHDFFEVRKGRIELVPLGEGRTKVVGTSWTVNRLKPLGYWRLWSDEIVRQTHREVFTEIRRRVQD